MRTLAIALLLSGAMMWAQSTAPQTAPAAKPKAGAAHSMHNQGSMAGMGQQHMQSMKTMLDQMKSNMDRLRTAISNVKDENVKAALQADYDTWQTVYGHMQQMQSSMQQHMQGMSGAEKSPSSGQEPPPQR